MADWTERTPPPFAAGLRGSAAFREGLPGCLPGFNRPVGSSKTFSENMEGVQLRRSVPPLSFSKFSPASILPVI
ncbi:hypothetical protein B4135_1384 [Caldibacillus debilis]|uniref:Uncharacterized protein n=1 Tax=Caldibacillus debilis TaxID=301148 RepID=A0A150MCF9_9BACI|nr:hypothetical protein B4135_1384 [Caldibacillus debilis]